MIEIASPFCLGRLGRYPDCYSRPSPLRWQLLKNLPWSLSWSFSTPIALAIGVAFFLALYLAETRAPMVCDSLRWERG